MSIKNYYRKLKALDKKMEELATEYKIPAVLFKLDCFISRVLDGATPNQYIGFRFYKLSERERRRFVTDGRSEKIEKAFNQAPASEIEMIANKAIFNKTFSPYIQRKWLYVPDVSEDELKAFVEQNHKIVIKPVRETQGRGIRLLSEEDMKDGISAFYQRAKKDRILVEEYISQHPALSEINPSSVNTARICTVRDRAGIVHVIGASLRGGGTNSIVDNLHADGVQYPVDVESGVIIRGGVKFNGEENIYTHPETNIKMIGKQIPNWDTVLQTVREAGTFFPNLRYIGWDVAVTLDGCELVEANIQQGSNGMQQDGEGKYQQIMKYK